MDRIIDPAIRRRRHLRQLGLTLAVAAAAVLLIMALVAMLSPGVDRQRIRTVHVERGPVLETLTASGTVVPRRETIITSSIDSRVAQVLVRPGQAVRAGQSLVELDLTTARRDLAQRDDQLALQANERVRQELALRQRRDDTASRLALLELDAEGAGYEARRNREYYDLGLISEDELRRSDTAARRARMEVQQLATALVSQDSSLTAELASLDLELAIEQRERDDVARRLELAGAASPRQGVVTWVLSEEGATVREGDELARVSDLSDYRVEAQVSDVHVRRVQAGQPVVVASGEQRLEGHVAAVRPTVQDGALIMEVALDEPDHPSLRPNLRVEVHVVTASRTDALRIKRGHFLARDGSHKAFVIRGERAERRDLELGLVSFEYFEVLSGLDEHDEVIISDMSDHLHRAEVRLR